VLKKNLSLIVFLYTISIIVVSIIPIPNLPLPKFNLLQPDKLFHFIVYFVMFLVIATLMLFTYHSLHKGLEVDESHSEF